MSWSHEIVSTGVANSSLYNDPVGYATNFAGEGPVPRVLYREGNGTNGGPIFEYRKIGNQWKSKNLTGDTGAEDAIRPPMGFATSNAAFVVYSGVDDHIHLLTRPAGANWSHIDLTERSGAPTVSDTEPMCYETNLPGQGSAIRVIYQGDDRHIHEISRTGNQPWGHADLTKIANAPIVYGRPWGYFTDLDGEDALARVVYLGEGLLLGDFHRVHELSVKVGEKWKDVNLSDKASAPSSPNGETPPMAYTTNLSGQGPAARVIYQTTDGHVHELSSTGYGKWGYANLNDYADDPTRVSGYSRPWGYFTHLSGQAPRARVVYLGDDDRIHQLSVQGGGGWSTSTLPFWKSVSSVAVIGYTTHLNSAQHPVARNVYRATDGDIIEVVEST